MRPNIRACETARTPVVVVTFLLTLLLILAPGMARAQWGPTAGPGRVGIQTLLPTPAALYAGSDGKGAFRSSNAGNGWTAANVGIENAHVLSLAQSGTKLFAGLMQTESDGGVYRSNDGGATWEPAKNGMGDAYVHALLAVDGSLFAGVSGNGVYKTTDGGESWALSNNGMGFETVHAFTRNGEALFAAGDNFLYRSDDGGAHWEFTDGGQYFQISSLYTESATYLYAGGIQGLIRSTDGGAHWSERIDVPFLGFLDRITSFWTQGGALYASTSSSPGSGGSGVIRSTDHGLNWMFANGGIDIVDTQALVGTGSRLIAASRDKSILISEDSGGSWDQSVEGIAWGGSVRDLLAVGNELYAGTEGDGVFRTTDLGATWIRASEEPSLRLRNATILTLASKPPYLFAGTAYQGLFRSSDHGASWVQASSGIPDGTGILGLAVAGSNVVAGTGERLFYSANNGDSWLPAVAPPATIPALAASGGIACANVVTGSFQTDGIYRSTDGGVVWNLVFQSLSASYIATMAAEGSWFYAGHFYGGGLIRSSDGGWSWGEGSPADYVYSVLPAGEELYTGNDASTGQAYRSTDHGSSWQVWNEGLPADEALEALAATTTYVFGGTNSNGVWRRLRVGSASAEETGSEQPRRLPFDLRAEGAMPLAGTATFRFTLEREEQVDLRVIDVAGRTVGRIASDRFARGDHEIRWDSSDLPSGVYFCRLSTAGSSAALRVVVERR